MPFVCMELASSWRRAASKTVRGWRGLGATSEIRIIRTRGVPDSCGGRSATAGREIGLLERSAERPLPKTLRCSFSGGLGTSQDLLCELNVAFGATGAYVVRQDGLTKAGRFCKANAAGNHRL